MTQQPQGQQNSHWKLYKQDKVLQWRGLDIRGNKAEKAGRTVWKWFITLISLLDTTIKVEMF